ncbi:glycosyltransferase [Brevundimonas variabilis]|uniref:Succinoglycan biosynthesis protein ExoL n=1 Tax=Brevundimonas variabilis TaxID=74312 RepID=A0A7W9FGD8_9CAUL|nr:glycosyltransferase [Brevundimonas variabilis]MBB5746339.1 succinoglycan biosynthesis protein ExoL [Brevundimonas variabilis]
MSVETPVLSSIAYLVPDLTDPAVRRRVIMLEAGGAKVLTAGFHRRPIATSDPKVFGLGTTADGAFAQRAVKVASWILKPVRLRDLVRDADIVIARNLEMLLLAWVALLGRSRVPLHYECLDVHRLMLGTGLASRCLRSLEQFLLKRVSRVIVSSPAFERNYFSVQYPGQANCLLIENRLVSLEGEGAMPNTAPMAAPPWIVGWFGMLRCRKSLTLLSEMAAASAGRIEVLISGRPSPAVFDDFEREVADLPGIRFGGEYTAADLPSLYEQVHFVWAIDFFEEGLNSSWLLPNRLYEGGAFNRPIIALAGLETARWLEARGAGLVLDNASDLRDRLVQLSPLEYEALVVAATEIPRSDLICDRETCRSLVSALAGRVAA